MKQANRDRLIVFVLIAVKLLTTLRTGIDTYSVSGDLLNVLLIDGAFLSLWLVAAYGGKGESALALRPFAALGAWVLYILMIVIGIEAHHSAVSLAVRAAGAFALAYDTYDYIVALAQRMRASRKGESLRVWQNRIDKRAYKRGYRKAMRRTQAAEAQTAVNAIARERIAAWTIAPDVINGEVVRALPASAGYTMLSDGRIACEDCGWVSDKAYDNATNANNAYSAHTRSARHQNVLVE